MSLRFKIAVCCAAAFVLLVWSRSPAHACAVCTGAAGDPQTVAMNGAIVTLLGVTGVVAAGVVGLMVRMRRHSRAAGDVALAISGIALHSTPSGTGDTADGVAPITVGES